ncbi:MAG: hypothetical protein KUG79_00165 [Pseudomonadales bacterium]|nr:hypothetical protein [Pseudomonadales bacterium]
MFKITLRISVSILMLFMLNFSYAAPPSSLPEGSRVEIGGKLEIFIREDLEARTAQHEFFLVQAPDAAPIKLLFVDGPPSIMRSGIGIKIRGTVRKGNVEVQAAIFEASSSEPQPTQEPQPTKEPQLSEPSSAQGGSQIERTAVVILVNASDVSHSATEIANTPGYYFGDQQNMKDMYAKISFGQLTIKSDVDNADGDGVAEPDGLPDVFGPVQSTRTAAEICSNPFSYVSEFLAAAKQIGVDPLFYQHRIFAVPKNLGCNWTGYANVGCGGSCSAFNRWSHDVNTTSHEMGHNLSMAHAGSGTDQYADMSSFLGYSTSKGVRALDAAHHWQMGWYQGYDSASTASVTTSGTYHIAPLQEAQDASNGPSVLAPSILRIDVNDGDPYFISARQATGYDTGLTTLNSAALKGINIHRYAGTGYARTLRVAQLGAGDIYTDTTNNLTITQVGGKDVDGIVELNINLGGMECIENNPDLALNPSFATVSPNTDYTYSVTLGNNNSTICGDSVFTLTVVPSTAGYFETNNLTVGAGGQKDFSLVIHGSPASEDINFTVSTAAELVTVDGTLTVDATTPMDITNLAASHSKKGKRHRVSLSWTDSTSTDAAGYEIYEQTAGLLATTTQNTYTDNLSGTIASNYTYTVKTIDNAGNTSIGVAVIVSTADDGGGGKGGGKGGSKKPN